MLIYYRKADALVPIALEDKLTGQSVSMKSSITL